jgi:xylulokinase
MKGSLYLGIDIGTSVAKGTIINDYGETIADAVFHRRHISHSEKIYEHDPENEWWSEFTFLVNKMLSHIGNRARDIQSIAITGMIPNICLMDKQGNPIRKAILYYDPRAENIEKKLDKELNTGKWKNQVLSRLIWLKDKEKENWKQTERILSTHNYIVFKLTGKSCIDTVTALEFGNTCNSEKMVWNHDLLSQYGIESKIFPDILPPGTIVGSVLKEASRQTGLREGTQVITGTTDTISSLIGSGLRNSNELLIYYGTYSCAMMLLSEMEKVIFDNKIKYPIDWLASIPRGGQQLSSLAQLFCPSTDIKESLSNLDSHAADSNPGANGVIFVQTLDLPVSTESTEPRGSFFNLGMNNTMSDICRAMLEAFGYGLKYWFELSNNPLIPRKCFAGGGGASSKVWQQIVSDITGLEQYCFRNADRAFGSAILAAISINRKLYDNITNTQLSSLELTKPNPHNHRKYLKHYHKYKNYIEKYS